MKDTFGYPKTLRNYPEPPTKPNVFVSPPHHVKSYKSLSSYNPIKTVQQQDHNVGDYYVLTNPSQLKTKQNKTKKNKKKSMSKQSHLSQALRQQLNRPMISHSQIGPQNIMHCRSLQKLQIISNDRSQEIKALMNEKGFLISQNQDLKAKLANPTYREQDYIQKIAQRQFEIQNLKQNLRRKQEIVFQVERDYKLQIEKLKVKHRQQIASLREEINKIRLEKINQSPRKYISTTHTTNHQRVHKPQTVYNTYNRVIEAKTSNVANSNTYRVNQNHESSTSPVVVHSHNYNTNYKPQTSNNLAKKSPQITQTDNTKQTFKTYMGEDGYERRVYQQTSESLENARNSTTINDNINSLHTQNNNIQTTTYSASNNANTYAGSPFTNEKITTYVNKETPSTTNLYKYSESSYDKQKYSPQYEYTKHNQNLYSNSLTFQCFNDFN